MRRTTPVALLAFAVVTPLVLLNSPAYAGPAAQAAPAKVGKAAAKDSVKIVLSRTSKIGTARGRATPVVKGRQFALQYKSGSTWVSVGAKVAESKKGTLSATFPIAGKRTYRFLGDAVAGGSTIASKSIAFDPGPKNLGTHVIYATTDSGAFPKTKGADYTGSAAIDDGSPIRLETLAVRGNSSARRPKKPYKLKFEEKTSVFGFPKDKTWILLPNYMDRSLIRTAVGMGIASKLDGLKWTPRRAFTELFVNGKYLGSYELIESIKIDKNRVDVDKETGVVVEMDHHFKEDGVPGFWGQHNLPYAMKDPDERKVLDDGKTEDPEGITNDKVKGWESRVKTFEKVLYGKDFKNPKTGWRKYLDEKSAVDYYLAKEFTKDWDGDLSHSNYFYMDDYDPKSTSKIFMGPEWDLDRSAAAKTTGHTDVISPKGWWLRGGGTGYSQHIAHKTHWFVQLTKDPKFVEAVEKRWKQKRADFRAVGNAQVETAAKELGYDVAANDRALWASSKSTGRFTPRAKTYKGEVAFVKDWYQRRYVWMNGQLLK